MTAEKATVELSSGSARIKARVTMAHTAPGTRCISDSPVDVTGTSKPHTLVYAGHCTRQRPHLKSYVSLEAYFSGSNSTSIDGGAGELVDAGPELVAGDASIPREGPQHPVAPDLASLCCSLEGNPDIPGCDT